MNEFPFLQLLTNKIQINSKNAIRFYSKALSQVFMIVQF